MVCVDGCPGGCSGTYLGLHMCIWGVALVQHLCDRACVARNEYRSGLKGIQVWLSMALHGQVRAHAARGGVSMQDWVADAIREKVMRDADGDAGRGVRGAAVADGGGPRDVSERGGSGAVGVGAADVAVALTPHAEVMASITKAEEIARMVDAALEHPRHLALVKDPLQVAVDAALADPFGSDTTPAGRDPRGRLLSPIIRDDCIDVP